VNIFSSHPSFERLVDLVEGRLPPAEQIPLLTHLSTCERCAAERAWLTQVIGLMRTDTGEVVPSLLTARARRLFRPRVAPISTERRRIPALLQFDSRQSPLGVGVRGGEPAARQLLLKAEGYDLDVRISPAGSAWQVSGQLLGPETTGRIELHGDSSTTGIDLNDLGEFSLPPVRPGRYRLLLCLPDFDAELSPLDLGSETPHGSD
jgi:hypothetical protein